MKEERMKEKQLLESPDGSDMIPTKYSTLGMLSLVLTCERIFPALHPALLSQANVQCMIGKSKLKKKEEKMELLSQHIEYFTGVEPSFPLRAGMNKWSKLLPRLHSQCQARH
eukprot:6469650-Amphidinium_carterae.1